MEQEVFEWKEEYNIGVDKIDNAHKELFALVNRIINNFMDRNFDKNKVTCMEAIKYLKSYTIKHFAEEEEYQLSINYPGYKTHKKVHDNMRNVVIPALEKEVAIKSYSKESLEHFAGACAGWLAAHVLIEDQAITGKTKSKWDINPDDDNEDTIDDIVKEYIRGLFRMTANLVSKKYTGHKLGRLFCCNDVMSASDGTVYSVVTAVEESMLEAVASRLINSTVYELDEVILSMVSEMFRSFNLEVMMAFMRDSFTSLESRTMPNDEFYKIFENKYPSYSMLWRTEYGYMALCISKKPQ